jgi:mannose-6-phosphate isomerase-like protein (cupin superfamily)
MSDSSTATSIKSPEAPAEYTPFGFAAGRQDLEKLKAIAESGTRIGNEQFDSDAYLDEIIPKPWGYEYRAYADDFFDFWALRIEAPHSTSMHVHPRKTTYLLCLHGTGVTDGLDQSVAIRAGSVLRIDPGAFHSTRNTGDEPLHLIEVETPRNKFDLMRLADSYDRTGRGYETDHKPLDSAPMRPVRGRPGARIRSQAPDGGIQYRIRTGYDVFYRRMAGDLFYVPLDLAGAVRRSVEILTNHPADERRPNTESIYLAIHQA